MMMNSRFSRNHKKFVSRWKRKENLINNEEVFELFRTGAAMVLHIKSITRPEIRNLDEILSKLLLQIASIETEKFLFRVRPRKEKTRFKVVIIDPAN